MLSSVLGRKIEYKHLDYESWKELKLERAKAAPNSVAARFASDHLLQHLQEVDHKNGVFAGTNDYILQIGGQPPTTLEEYIKHKAAFD